MTKHTPEPWALCYSGSHIFIVDANYNAIASLDFDSKTKEANAALIARAPELLAENKKLQARIAELEAERMWQPIETAPKDGSYIALMSWDGCWVIGGHWYPVDGFWALAADPRGDYQEPTHWMPLPKMEDE